MRFRRRKEMASRRAHSLSSEKRLQQRYPDQYPEMIPISPGCVVARADEDDAFSQWLISTPLSER